MKLLLVILVMIPFVSEAQPAKSPFMQLDSLFNSYIKPGEPGAAVLVAIDDKVVFQKGYGLSDLVTREPITTATLFNIGSISKTFVAYGILKLAQEKKLSLDDPLDRYFPDFGNKEIAREVRLYHLLTHSSGIPDNRPVKEQHDFYLTARDEENFAPLKRTDKTDFQPGSRYKYSNPTFNGLALIIEQLTGKKWQAFIKEQIFEPAGMKTSTITDGPHPESGVSHGYIRNEKGNFEELDYGEEPTFAASGNGGVWSSVEELWKYEKAVQQAKFLDKDWIKRSRTVYKLKNWEDPQPSKLGLSWFLTRSMGMDMIGHTGSQGGFISDYSWFPEKKIFYVLLCNYPYPLNELREKVFAILK